MKRQAIIIGAIIATVLLTGAIALTWTELSGSGSAVLGAPASKPKSPAPAFTLQGLEGESYQVGGIRDKALIINFWASWCEPCQEEAPDLVRNYEQYKDKLDIYGVNATKMDNIDDVKKFISERHINFPVLLDEHSTAADLYHVNGYPTSFLIDKNGVIRDVILGQVSSKELDHRIKQLVDRQ